MAQEIADSKLLDTWGSGGNIVKPDISKIIEGWQLGEQPPHEYMNWLQNTFGSKLNHILKNGVASWNNETEYLDGSSVQHNDNVWLCKVTNTNSEPTDENANWKRIITVEALTTVLAGYVATTENIAQLKLNSNMGSVDVLGYYTKGDGGGGTFYWDSTSTEEDNGSTIIQATGITTGRWKRADNIDLSFPKLGTVNKKTQYSYIQSKSALRIGGSDTTDLNDEKGYWSGLPSRDSWGDSANIGEFSVAFNRNGASYGTYSTTFGHDCVTYGTASFAGGAGSCVGDPSNPSSSNFEGYCSIAFGKNNLALGEKSVSMGEENKSYGRASVTLGYSNEAGVKGVDIGAVALGNDNKAIGDGSLALGSYVIADNGSIAIGKGANAETKLNNARTNSVGFGNNRANPSLFVNDDSSVEVYDAPLIMGVPLGGGRLTPKIKGYLLSDGRSGYAGLKLSAIINGVDIDIVEVSSDFDIPSFMPITDNTSRLGTPSQRWGQVFAGTGTINTSDDREKTYLDITEVEKKVALELKANMKKFKFNEAIASKGEDKARIHFGTSAQTVKTIFEKYGLVAEEYALLCYDEWEDVYEQVIDKDEVLDKEGNIVEEAIYKNGNIIRPAGNRYGIRYDELLCFIMSAL